MKNDLYEDSLSEDDDIVKVAHSSPSEKDIIIKIAYSLEQDGLKGKKLLDFLKRAGVPVPARTYCRWRHCFEETGSATPHSVHPGRPRLLTDEQEKILGGFIFDKNQKNEEVHENTIFDFLHASFGVVITERTASNYARKLGFTQHWLKFKKSGYVFFVPHLVDMGYGWVFGLLVGVYPSKVCCIDVTFTGHRTDRHHGYVSLGRNHPQTSLAVPSYTNAVVVCVWADGVNRTPPVLFSYNKAFMKGPRYPRGRRPKGHRTELDAVSQWADYGLSMNLFEYIAPSGHSSNYCSESPDILRRFFAKYEIPEHSVIFSDDGNAFFEKQNDVLLDLGFWKHHTFEPCVHQFFSVCDNNLLGVAKAEWRSKFDNFLDDPLVSALLLGILMKHNDKVVDMFKRNLLVGSQISTKERVEKLIVGHKNDVLSIHAAWHYEYLRFAGEEIGTSKEGKIKELFSTFDGIYWLK